MIIDILIVIFAVSALYRGREIGFIRQLFSTVGFFGGLLLGAWLQPHTITIAHSQAGRSIITLITTLGCALLLFSVGEYIGIRLKYRVRLKRFNTLDNGFGGALSIVSLLLTVWLTAAIIGNLPFPGLQSQVSKSHIVSALNHTLPSAPGVISRLGHLIDPNGFPQVFVDGEPAPQKPIALPSLGTLQAAVNKDRASVVKLEGQGCGGIVEGSGFVVGPNLVATNAHVVAGIKHPYVEDDNGTHSGTVIWFDPNLDFAVLRVSNLSGNSLIISNKTVAAGTPAAVLGYPGGGSFTAGPAAVRDEFNASGRDIYGKGNTDRDVYELQATVRPGNSGGPLVSSDGTVIGVIFAESTNYPNVGYALTTSQINGIINPAAAANRPVSTGQCAE
jgi:S1-C subfamily serine protease